MHRFTLRKPLLPHVAAMLKDPKDPPTRYVEYDIATERGTVYYDEAGRRCAHGAFQISSDMELGRMMLKWMSEGESLHPGWPDGLAPCVPSDHAPGFLDSYTEWLDREHHDRTI